MVNRYEAVGIALMGLAVALASPVKADTLTVRVIRQPATVAGLPQAPTAHGFYRTGAPRVASRPSAGILHSLDGAPPNGCPTLAFEVVSGPVAQRGCYGGR